MLQTGPHTVFLVRHGRTSLNAAGVLRGRLDPELDPVGLAEAAVLASVLGPCRPSLVVSSPLLRARQTAAPIAAAVGLEVIPADGLIDRDYGRWAGHSLAEVEDQWGSVDAAPGVEPLEALAYRAMVVLDQQLSRLGDRPVVLVSHDAVNRTLLAALCPELGPAAWIGQRTACWNRIERHEGAWRVLEVDQKPAG